MTPKQTAEKRVRELVPSTMELSFGCEVLLRYGSEKVVLNGSLRRYDFTGDNFAMCWGENGSKSIKYAIIPDTYDGSVEVKETEIYEILGHPLQLSDVLLAIDNHLYLSASFSIDKVGGMRVKYLNEEERHLGFYNLTKPFSEQEEQVYLFINEILQ